MRKVKVLFAIVMAFALAISFSLISSAKTESATVSMNSAEGGAGQKVSVTAEISNNPGIVSMYLALEYDTTRLKLVEAIDSGLLAGSTFGETVEDYPYGVTWDDSLSGKDNLSNGVIVTFVFEILEDAPLGEAFVSLKNNGGIINNNLESVEFEFANTFVRVIDYVPESKIIRTEAKLSEAISMSYYAVVDGAHADAKMCFTMNGREYLVSGVPTEVAGEYRYDFCNIAPQCMCDNIKAELILGTEVLDSLEEYSIREYCDNLFADIEAKKIDGYTEEKYSSLRVLLVDMLEYGAAAQIYRGYNTTNLANAGVSGKSDYVALDGDSEKYVEESELDNAYFVSAGIRFDSVNRMYFEFVAEDVDPEAFAIRIKNYDTEEEVMYYISDCILTSEGESKYIVYTDGILPYEYGTWFSAEICTLNSRGRWVSRQLVEYSLESYVYSVQNDTDSTMAALARAMHMYGLAAYEFKKAQ